MTTELPAPLVPHEIDLRDYPEFPLEFERLFASETWANWTDRERVVGLRLWCFSWHEEPCGSLPDNNRVLSTLAGYGDSPSGLGLFTRVRKRVLEDAGWVLCQDGRLYHPVVAEKAIDKWKTKRKKEIDNEADRNRKRRKRQTSAGQFTLSGLSSSGQVAGQVPHVHPENDEVEGKRREEEGRLSSLRDLPARVMESWNAMAARTGLPKIAGLGHDREQAILARVREHSIEAVANATAMVEASAFLTGRRSPGNGHENWRCDFDFVFKRRDKFRKLVEGGYNDGTAAPPPDKERTRWIAKVTNFFRTGFWDENWDGPRPGLPGCRAPADLIALLRPAKSTAQGAH